MTIYKKRKQVLLLVIGAAPDERRKYLLIASYLVFLLNLTFQIPAVLSYPPDIFCHQ
jgi:hypothetical protein